MPGLLSLIPFLWAAVLCWEGSAGGRGVGCSCHEFGKWEMYLPEDQFQRITFCTGSFFFLLSEYVSI